MENINLYELKKAFVHNPIVVLEGENGVGKTCLADAYIKDDDCKDKLIYNLDARSYESAAHGCRELIEKLNLTEASMKIESAKISDMLSLILDNLREKSFLIVFDNIKTVEVEAGIDIGLRDKKLSKNEQQVLLISEKSFCIQNATNLTLLRWTRDESYLFLFDNLLLDSNQKIDKRKVELLVGEKPELLTEKLYLLAKRLNDLPLALNLAQLYIKNTGASVAEYLESLELMVSQHNARLEVKYAVMFLSFQEAFKQKGAKEIMQLMAFKSDGISKDELTQTCIEKWSFSSAIFDNAMGELEKYGLLLINDVNVISAHDIICDNVSSAITSLNTLQIFPKGISRSQKRQNLTKKADILDSLEWMLSAVTAISSVWREAEELKPFFNDLRKLNHNEYKCTALLNRISHPQAKNSVKAILLNLSRKSLNESTTSLASENSIASLYETRTADQGINECMLRLPEAVFVEFDQKEYNLKNSWRYRTIDDHKESMLLSI